MPAVETDSRVEQEQAIGKESLALQIILLLLVLLFLGGIAAVARILSTTDHVSAGRAGLAYTADARKV